MSYLRNEKKKSLFFSLLKIIFCILNYYHHISQEILPEETYAICYIGLPTLFRKFYSYMASATTIRRILSGKSNDSKVCRGEFMQYRHVLETLSNSVLHHSAQSQKNIISPQALQPTPCVNVFVFFQFRFVTNR